MSEVALNEEVTAEVLNNIGVDLGQTEFSYFQDNMPYAVHQLNQITSDLVSSGVLRTGANGALGCEVIAPGGAAFVQAGVIVFASGAKIRITIPVGIDIVPGTYIYALNDTTTGKASLQVSESVPAGDYVLLAEVDADGVLVDRRNSCVAKVTMTADPQNIYRTFTAILKAGVKAKEAVVDVGSNAFSYVCLMGVRKFSSTTIVWGPGGNNMVPFEDGTETVLGAGNHQWESEQDFGFKREGQRITVNTIGASATEFEVDFMVL